MDSRRPPWSTLESVEGVADSRVFDSQHAALESGLGATDLRITEDVLCAGCRPRPCDYASSDHGTGRATSGDVGGRGAAHR